MSLTKTKQPFLALSKICLNNWHYIDQKILSFNDGINFFTGHSGSGKSTVIDAMQIVLYANTDGRGFFNKAAADDSDRNLIEYLRGMVAVGEKDEVTYLRNKNFSTTIVLEFTQTESDEKECLGVVFDVDTARNDTSRLFFWHKGGILENAYRTEEHAMTISELRKYMQKNFKKEDFYFGTSNERFRKQMYDIYLGGLDMEKFPRLFKRAIPFKMNIKLEDFVKEYICMEQDIHIEDMQESVMQYGRMRQRIEDTLKEAKSLEEIKESFVKFKTKKEEQDYCQYRMNKLDVLKLKSDIHLLQQKIEDGEKDLKSHLIRCIGKPEERFEEDALRILRGLRFSAQLGFTIEEETKQAMLELKGLLNYLSMERIREEILRLLVGKQAQRVIKEEKEILKVVLPEVNFEQKTELDKLPQEALFRFAYLIEELPKETVRKITYRFKFSNEQRDSLHDITDLAKEPLPRNKYELKFWLRGTSEKNVQFVFLLKGLKTNVSKVNELYNEIMSNQEIYRLKDLTVDGKDLLKLGYEGPQIGEELNKILEAVMRDKLNNDKKSIYQFLGKEPSC